MLFDEFIFVENPDVRLSHTSKKKKEYSSFKKEFVVETAIENSKNTCSNFEHVFAKRQAG